MARTLDVFLHADFVGRLRQDDSGRLSFAYDERWAVGDRPPLSLSLPTRLEPFDHKGAEPFFGGLLPEEGVRVRIARFLGVSARNDFALLAEIGGECAGAVTLLPAAEPPVLEPEMPASAERTPAVPLSDDALKLLLDELPRRPLLAGGEARLSLAGAQDKVAVVLCKGEIALPTGSEPTTHILKTPIDGYQDTVANELVCMQTARRLGMSVARVERRTCEGTDFLLVERFDRVRQSAAAADSEAALVRRHQEDICQALGVPTRMKYQKEGGPSLADCFGLLTTAARRPAVDRLALLRATIFNVLIGNADAHAKNFSLLHLEKAHGRNVELSPLYDLLSTLVYEDLSPRYAMKIGSKSVFKELRGKHWDTFAESAGLSPAQVRRELREMCKALPAALEATIAEQVPEVRQAPTLGLIEEQTALRCEASRALA